MAGLNDIQLRDDQRAIMDHPARFKVVACGRRWGKTTLGLVMAINAAREGKRVWWVVCDYKMGYQHWLDLKDALQDEWVSKHEHQLHIILDSGGSITMKSASNPNSLRGAGLDFVILDEAAFMRAETWTHALRPTLSDRDGSALIISTPRAHNWFHRVFRHAASGEFGEWQAWSAPTADNPLIRETDIEEARRTLPHFAFEQEYLAQFVSSGGEVFRSVPDAVINVEEEPIPTAPEPKHDYVMGVDFGRYNDYTVCTVIDQTTGRMVAMDRFKLVGWAVQRSRIAAFARQWNVSEILAESNAMGEPNIEALRDQEHLDVTSFRTNRQSKVDLIDGLVRALEEGALKIIPDETLIDELSTFAYDMQRVHLVYSAPTGHHDDTVIALALAWKIANTVSTIVLGIAEVHHDPYARRALVAP